METLEIQKKINQKYAFITLLQILFILIVPSYYQVSNSLNLKTGTVISGYLLLGTGYLLTVRMKSQTKQSLCAHSKNIR